MAFEDKKLPSTKLLKNRQIEKLIESNALGLQLPTQQENFIRNYAIFQPLQHIRRATQPSVFIHGRELFSPEFAAQYFAEGYDSDNAPYEAFNEKAKSKIRYWFEPESQKDRFRNIFTYSDRYTRPKIKEDIKYDRQRFNPDIDFSNLPRFKGRPTASIASDHRRKLAENGRYSTVIGADYRLSPATHIIDSKAERRTLAGWAEYYWKHFQVEYASLFNLKRSQSLKPHLWEYIKTQHYDPEMIANFFVGLENTPSDETSITAITGRGKEARLEYAVRTLAKQISNPYQKAFTEGEKEFAGTIVNSLNPRLLALAEGRKTKIIYTKNQGFFDNGDNLVAPITVPGTHAIGHYKANKHSLDKGCADEFILIATPGYNNRKNILKHEFEHLLDGTHPMPFVEFYPAAIDKALAEDRENLRETIAWVEGINTQSTEKEKKSFFELAELTYSFPLKEESGLWDEHENIEDAKYYLLDELRFIHNKILVSSPAEIEEAEQKEMVMGSYPTRYEQVQEIPAIVAEFKGARKALLKRVLPETWELVRQHRYHHPALRNKPAQSR